MSAAQLTRRAALLGGVAAIPALHRLPRKLARLDAAWTPPPMNPTPTPTGPVIVNDDFDGRGLDHTTWAYGFPGGATEQLSLHQVMRFTPGQVVVDRTEQTPTGAGVLQLIAKPASGLPDGLTWESGAITTRETFGPYVHVTVDAMLPKGAGLWSEICTFAPKAWPPELDEVEVESKEPDTVHNTYHWRDAAGVNQQAGGGAVVNVAAWHRYELFWQPTRVVWLIDGIPSFAVTSASEPIPDVPMGLTLGLGVGGVGSWPGPTDASTPVPSIMRIGRVLIEGLAA